MIKIGILTYFSPVNYGAYLQAYALSNRLNQYDCFDAVLINFKAQSEVDYYKSFLKPEKNFLKSLFYRKRNRTFLREQKKLPLSESSLVSNNIAQFDSFIKDKYDIIVVGSDEIWKIDGYRGYPTPYFMLSQTNARKFSYAASGRTPFDRLSHKELQELKKAFSSYEYIGVRDEATHKEIKNLLGNGNLLHLNLDPTFIYNFKPNKENGRRILKERYHIDISKKVIAVMFLEEKPTKPKLVGHIKQKFGDDIELVSLYEWVYGVKNTPQLTPLEWVDVIAAVDCVISMYFHAICFALKAGTPFFAIENRAKNNSESKIFDLLKKFDMLEFYELGLQKSIDSGKIISTINDCDKIKFDISKVVAEGQKEFDSFVEKLREENKPL